MGQILIDGAVPDDIMVDNQSIDRAYIDGQEVWKHPSFTQRGVMSFNGSQWGELSEPVVLDGDFEIEWVGISELGSVQRLTCSDDFKYSIYINIDGAVSIKATNSVGVDKYVTAVGSNASTGSIVVVTMRRVGDVFYISCNGTQSSLAIADIPPFVVDKLFQRHDNTQRLSGTTFGFNVWTNGDRNTGDLILDVPFDESGSDYQRNRAVALGAELVTNGDFSDGLDGWNSDTEFYVNDGNLTIDNATQQIDINRLAGDQINVVADQGYMIEIYVQSLEGILKFATYDTSGMAYALSIGMNRFVHTPQITDDRDYGFRANTGCSASIKSISMKKWSGVILQNTLPGDWSQYERRDGWAFYRKVGEPTIRLEDAT